MEQMMEQMQMEQMMEQLQMEQMRFAGAICWVSNENSNENVQCCCAVRVYFIFGC